MYERVLVGVDGSECSNYAAQIALRWAELDRRTELLGCHVYAAEMHRSRFQEMEPGLPADYQSEERLSYLRSAHEGIISGGMKLISDSYLKELEQEAVRRQVAYRSVTPEGRNHVQLLKLAREAGTDLVVLGAHGQGKVPEAALGSLCERALLGLPEGDILVARKGWSSRGPIVVGVDGSAESFRALERALALGRATDAPVWAAAVYDPFFHGGVFRSVSGVLTEEGKQSFNFSAQEQLHDKIIDQGLETVYRNGLERGRTIAEQMGVELHTEVLMGKVFAQIHHFCDVRNARLAVVGRWGLHREGGSLIGSNAHNLVRIANTNVLVVGDPLKIERTPLAPPTVQAMSQEGGPGGPSVRGDGGARSSTDPPVADVVVLKKMKRLAPDFHRHIVQGRLQGQEISTGEKVLIYEVQETVPGGRVKVGPSTRLEFK